MGGAKTTAGWKEETSRKGPQRSRTFRRASAKMPDLHLALGFSQWHPRCSSSARVELGDTQGRCLEPVGQDFWEEFQAGESWTPADWPPFSVREGVLCILGRGPQFPLEQQSKDLSLHQAPRLRGENKELILP